MKNLKKWPKQKWFANAVALCIAILFYLLLSNLNLIWGWVGEATRLLKPIILGIVFAYIVNPVCVFFEKKVFIRFIRRERLRHSASVVTGLLVVLVLIVILLTAFIPQVISSVVGLVSNAASYTRVVQRYVLEFARIAEARGLDMTALVDRSNDVINEFLGIVPDQMNGILATSYEIGMRVADVLIGAILAVYLLMDKWRMLDGIDRLMQAMFIPSTYREAKAFFHQCNVILIRFVGFDLLDGLIVGIANMVFMTIMDMPYATLISVIVGVTNLAPTFGPIAGAAIGAFILVLVNPVQALIFVIFTIVLQILDGYVIKPRIFGSSLGVPAVWVLIALVVGGKLFGVVGILLGIPFAAIFSYIYESFIDKKIEASKAKQIAKEIKPESNDSDSDQTKGKIEEKGE